MVAGAIQLAKKSYTRFARAPWPQHKKTRQRVPCLFYMVEGARRKKNYFYISNTTKLFI